ncbi:hypothetical protein HY345_03910 [Candidatus Microgenomates bacterium]|nr:hypothetical protein [Candidatus Microgenomates bacterium]
MVKVISDEGEIINYKKLCYKELAGCILSFPKLSEKSKTVTLTISRVDKIVRIFKWHL